MQSESRFLDGRELNVVLTRMKEVNALLVVLRKIRDMDGGYYDLVPAVQTLQTIYKAILSTTRVHIKRIGITVERMDDTSSTSQTIWIGELNRTMQKIFKYFENPPTGDINLEIRHMLTHLCFLFDVPRFFNDDDTQMTYVKLDDPGDMRHIFQENEIFIEQLERIIHQLCCVVLGERKIWLKTLIRRYEILQDGLTESMKAFIIEKLAIGHMDFHDSGADDTDSTSGNSSDHHFMDTDSVRAKLEALKMSMRK